jgi:signal transduction histidine kinase
MDDILVPNSFDIPAIVTDSETGLPSSWRNLGLDSTFIGLSSEDSLRLERALRKVQVEMDQTYAPIPIEITFPGITDLSLRQQVHYGESPLIGELRMYPFLQLGFVALFIVVGYLGFSYVRKSEQSSLWVGMAKEAAHQLGTPISSLMGWIELLRMDQVEQDRRLQAVAEMDKDVERLRRVAGRFSDIGSLPKLETVSIEEVLTNTVEYMRRRTPQFGGRIELRTEIAHDLRAPLNAELFEWVVENLLKNAMDALEGRGGEIIARGSRTGESIQIDISDTGKGIDRREWKNVFRPGYSTKKRGWGLGLSLAKRIVEDYHGGSLVLLQSRVGFGTTFRIEIPADGAA